MKGLCEGPWVTGGHFNTVRCMAERRGCSRTTNIMADFFKWVEDLELHDPILIGGKYTWIRGPSHSCNARLGRSVYSIEWEVSFKNIRQRIMPKVTLDQNPILWSVEIEKKGVLILNLKIGGLRSRVLMSWSRNGGMASQLKDAHIISYVTN